MKFKFKIQPFQTEAVKSVTDVLQGQPFVYNHTYIRDIGRVGFVESMEDREGFSNPSIVLADDVALKNIRNVQSANNLPLSDKLEGRHGKFTLDIEMETGTGKTYVYIKTIFELNKLYGFMKFIIIVPSIAIREGVRKSFEMTSDHFMEYYGKKARYFIYTSKNLHELDSFSSDGSINVIIINSQAFNATGKDQRKIYEEQDDFASRKPIDVIAANRPILILDEPQKLAGEKTQNSLTAFKPLFCLHYSATHKEKHNVVYALDALDAYNKKIVKKIEVKGFERHNLKGTNGYIYLDTIMLSPKEPPKARIELEVKRANGIKRETRIMACDNNLYIASNELEQYKNGYVIKEINPLENSVTFLNGETITAGVINGDPSDENMKRIQIRETIISHFEKEEKLFNAGIKILSLFFIDEVAKYRQYNENGNKINGEYGKIFEEEYNNILANYINNNDNYTKYLKDIPVDKTHEGYFSIDKKSNRMVNPEANRTGESDDISAYDLILKKKEMLLSFNEPVRFIFSHSALREGWDNPNVFQICTLKHSNSVIGKRQEVGRGLRLAVNQDGERIDAAYTDNVHDINKLTVIASESYDSFAKDLQKEIHEALSQRPLKATVEYFVDKTVVGANGESLQLDAKPAKKIYQYLVRNEYIDEDDNVTDKYRTEAANNILAPLPQDMADITEGVQKLVASVFDKSVLESMVSNGKDTKISNILNENFAKKEFKTLWNAINHKYAYSVSFDSDELIKKTADYINENLHVTELQFIVKTAEQKDAIDRHELERGETFTKAQSRNEKVERPKGINIKYDLVGKIATGTNLTRKTAAVILANITEQKFNMFKANPEEFIAKVTRMANEQKASMIVDHITYNQIDGKYDNDIFIADSIDKTKALEMKKHILQYVVCDSNTEKDFAEALEGAAEVNIYAKLPRNFHIPTPVGKYSPDWAIVFHEKGIKHIYFIAETKGSMDSLQLRQIEKAKISCAKKLFDTLSTEKIKYDKINNFQELMGIVK